MTVRVAYRQGWKSSISQNMLQRLKENDSMRRGGHLRVPGGR